MSLTNIILTGGINHDFEDTAEALKEVLSHVGIQSVIYADIDAGFDAIDREGADLITLFTLRWRMLDHDKYIPDRQQWAYEISERDRNNLMRHLSSGRGLLGLHTASICFDTWEEWPTLLGVNWTWGETFHPPPATFTVSVEAEHPSTAGLSEFKVTDEIYHHLHSQPDATPLLFTRESEDGSNQTLAWAHQYQSGRVIYDAMGHDRASVTATGHARFLQQSARWCCGVDS